MSFLAEHGPHPGALGGEPLGKKSGHPLGYLGPGQRLLVAEGRMAAISTDDYWLDTGRPELYLQANLDLLSDRRGTPLDGVAPDAVVDPSASITRFSSRPVANWNTSPVGSSGQVVFATGAIGRGAVASSSIRTRPRKRSEPRVATTR